jgi:anthranilate/para-aminobenzoate synthase component I
VNVVDEAAHNPRGPKILRSSPSAVALRELGAGPDPAVVFEGIAARPGAFFLDSASGPEALSRWSFLGADPFTVLECSERTVTETVRGSMFVSDARPFDALRTHLNAYRALRIDSPLPLMSGAVGFLGYDLKHEIERLPCTAARDQRFPEMHSASTTACSPTITARARGTRRHTTSTPAGRITSRTCSTRSSGPCRTRRATPSATCSMRNRSWLPASPGT